MTTKNSQSTTESSQGDPIAAVRAARIRARRDLAWYLRALRFLLATAKKLLNGAVDSATVLSIADQIEETEENSLERRELEIAAQHQIALEVDEMMNDGPIKGGG